ncbi:MAG: OmpA family protein [Elusimicrobia bacterium]|nr:OmpA family protein [Elusimicrobiota bacterium]
MRTKTLLISLLPVFMALTAFSCKKNVKTADAGKIDMTADTATIPPLDITESADTLSGESDIRGGEFISQETIQTVRFEFDRYALSDETRTALQKNAATLKIHKDWLVKVEGHCDSRGTIEYNLALGQKRAKEVRDYYIRLGVPESSLGTISYGKEKPLCEEESEACWADNRRAETRVKVK